MIGPGWMPSRPRPLPRPRRGALYLLGCSRRRRRTHAAAHELSDAIRRDGRAAACNTRPVLFDGPRTKLPVATLLASGSQTRRRMDLDRWLVQRWDWVRPRAVPLLAAFVGLLLTLGAVKYTSLLSYAPDQVLHPRRAPVSPTRFDAAVHAASHAPRYQGLSCEDAECMTERPHARR